MNLVTIEAQSSHPSIVKSREAPITRPSARQRLDLEARVARWHRDRRLEAGPCGARHDRHPTGAGRGQDPPGDDLGGAVPARVHRGRAARLAGGARGRGERQADPLLEGRAVAEVGTGEARLRAAACPTGCTRRGRVPSPSRRTRCRSAAAACRPCIRFRTCRRRGTGPRASRCARPGRASARARAMARSPGRRCRRR